MHTQYTLKLAGWENKTEVEVWLSFRASVKYVWHEIDSIAIGHSILWRCRFMQGQTRRIGCAPPARAEALSLLRRSASQRGPVMLLSSASECYL